MALGVVDMSPLSMLPRRGVDDVGVKMTPPLPSSSESVSTSSKTVGVEEEAVLEICEVEGQLGSVAGSPAPLMVMTFAVSCFLSRASMAILSIFDLQAPLSRCWIIPGRLLNFLVQPPPPRHFTGLWSLEVRCRFSSQLLANLRSHGSQG